MIVDIPDKGMTVEFPDGMDIKEIERQIYINVYDRDVISPVKEEVNPLTSLLDDEKYRLDNPYQSAPEEPIKPDLTGFDRIKPDITNLKVPPSDQDFIDAASKTNSLATRADEINRMRQALSQEQPQTREQFEGYKARVGMYDELTDKLSTDIDNYNSVMESYQDIDDVSLKGSVLEDPKTFMAYAPYIAVSALKGAMQPALSPLKTLGMDTEGVLNTAIEYWKKKLPEVDIPNAGIGFDEDGDLTIQRIDDMPLADIVGATSEGAGFLAPASAALKGGSLVAQQLGKYARPFYQSILSGMIGGALLGEGKKDETLENMALFGVFSASGYGASKIPSAVKKIKSSAQYAQSTLKDKGLSIEALNSFLKKKPDASVQETVKHFQDVTDALTAIKNSKIYRKLDSMTVKERGLVVQSMEEVFKRNPNMTLGEKARLFEDIYKKEFSKRATGEGVKEKAVKKQYKDGEVGKKKIEDTQTGGMTPEILESIPDPVVRAFAEGRMSGYYDINKQTKTIKEEPVQGIKQSNDTMFREPIKDGRIIIRFSDNIKEDLSRGWSGFMGERSDISPEDAVQQDFGEELKFEQINNTLYHFFGEDGEKLGEVRRDPNTGEWVHVDHDGVAGFDLDYSEYGNTLEQIMDNISKTPYSKWDFSETSDSGKIWKNDNPIVLYSGDLGNNKDVNILLVGASKKTNKLIEKTHTHSAFKNKEFVRTAEGQKAMFYGDRYFEKLPTNKDLNKNEIGTNAVLDNRGNPAGAVIAVPTGRILVYDAEKAAKNQALIQEKAEAVKKQDNTKMSDQEQNKIKVTDSTVKVEMPKKEADALKPKEQKAYLIDEVDEAIKKAKNVPINKKATLDEYNVAKKNVGTITIKVPGDGEFTILNSKEVLTQFKKRIKGFPANDIVRMPKPKGLTKPGVKPLNKRVVDFAGEYLKDYVPGKTPTKMPEYGVNQPYAGGYGNGYYTDNKFAILTKKPKTKRPIKDIPDAIPKLVKGKLHPAVIEKEFYINPTGKTKDGSVVVNVKAKNKYFKYNPEYLDIIFKKYPDAKPYVADMGLLVLKQNKKVVGLVAQKKVYDGRAGTPSGYASTGEFTDIPVSAMEMPELYKLAKELAGGKVPGVKRVIGRNIATNGIFIPKGDGKIIVKADLFKNPEQALKTLAHEVGHIVDYLDDKTLKRGNILGRIASLKKYMKKTLAPKGATKLTKADRERLKEEAKKLSEKWIDEIIIKETPVGASNILDIWNNVDGSINKELAMYIKKASTAEKKAIVTAALKGKVLDAVKHFGTKEEIKTGKKIKVLDDEGKIYKDLIEKEIAKRKLLKWEEITEELKAFTLKWKPFDPSQDKKFTRYRFSSPELYADALSAIITNPEYLKQQAPKFYEAFFDFLGNKPIVKDIYADIMAIVNKTPREKAKIHLDDIIKMFEKSTAKRNKVIQDSKQEPIPVKDEVLTALWDKSHGALKVIRKLEKIPGVMSKDAKVARMAVQELQHLSSLTGVHFADFNELVLKPLKKAGITLDELGAMGFYKRIGKGDRFDKANPLGIDQKTATRDLKILGEELWGKDKFKKIEKILKDFRKSAEQEVFPILEESNILTPHLMKLIKENKHYVKWDVAAYFDDVFGAAKGTSKIYRQIGTFADIDNPIVATLLQEVSLLAAAKTNLIKQDIVKALRHTKEITPAQLKYSLDKKGRIPIEPKRGEGILTVFEKSDPGKPHYYYVSKDIAKMFEYDPIEASHLFNVWFGASRVAKELMVGKNPAWMLRNLNRDVIGAIKNTPKVRLRHIPEILKIMVDVAPEVFAESFHRKPSARIRNMKKNMGLPQFRVWSSKDDTFDNEIVRQLTELKLISDTQSKLVPEKIMQIWETVDNAGYMSEIWSKVAIQKFLEDKGWFSEREMAQITRELAGTPDAKQRSKHARFLNSVFLFSEMRKAGLRQMATAYKKDKFGYAWKTVWLNMIPSMLKHLLLANSALIGTQIIGKMFEGDDEAKEMAIKVVKQASKIYDRIPAWDLEHYDCYSVGLTKTGKAVYLRFPMDYEGQVFGTFGYLAAKEIHNQILGKGDPAMTYQKMFKTMADQRPYNWHPFITMLYTSAIYASGGNPKNWKGYDVIPRRVYDTGGTTYIKESMPYIARELWNSSGLGSVWKFGHGDLKRDEEWYETALKAWGGNAIGSYIRFSDRGISEKIRRKWELVRQSKAKESLEAYKAVVKLANGDVTTVSDIIKEITKPGVTKKKIEKTIGLRSDNVYTRMLMRANNNQERAIVLIEMANEEVNK